MRLIEYSSREEAEEDPVDLGEEEVSQCQSSSIESRRRIILGVFVKDVQLCQVKLNICTVNNSLFFLQVSGFMNRL